ncbi:MAG: hypothetical protein Q8L78_06350 [Coxiellaceae bacterium]|nr:hypothetical protein [Coxiellaceae bacterium]
MQETLKKSHWLIISHDFNMDGRAPSLTITDKIPYLLDANITLHVISAVTGKKDSQFPHDQLLPWGPSALRFDFRHWLKTRLGKGFSYKFATTLVSLLVLPLSMIERGMVGLSSQWSWSYPAAFRARQLIKKNKIDLVYTTGGAWSAHYAGYLIKKSTRITWIAEVHDPLVENDLLKKTKDQKFQASLEKKIAAYADLAWWFTENALKQAQTRHPRLIENGFSVRPGSIPPGCFEPLPKEQIGTDTLNIMHFGSLADDRSFAPLLETLSLFFKNHPSYQDKIKIHVYGTSLDNTSKAAVEKFSMHSIMVLHGRVEQDKKTGKSGREVIMDIMRHADVLLLLHGNRDACSQYIPSKLYDYSWTDRPIFALTHQSEELDQLLEKRHAYIAHTVDQASILNTLEILIHDWKDGKLRKQIFNPVTPKDAVDEILKRVNG